MMVTRPNGAKRKAAVTKVGKSKGGKSKGKKKDSVVEQIDDFSDDGSDVEGEGIDLAMQVLAEQKAKAKEMESNDSDIERQ